MSGVLLTAEDLLAGADLTVDVELPEALLPVEGEGRDAPRTVRLRPLTVKDVQLVARAARDDDVLTSALMVQQSLVEPRLRADQVARLPGGLVRFLVEQVNGISGLRTSEDELRETLASPLVQAFVALSREYGWTPEQVRELTVAQVLGYLELAGAARGRS